MRPAPGLLLLRLLAAATAAIATTVATGATVVSAISSNSIDRLPSLLVLRSACGTRDPAYFNVSALRGHALTTGRNMTLGEPFRVLSYDETCGSLWREPVTRNGLNALAAGSMVASAGQVGAAVCGVWAAVARGLRTPLPIGCSAPAARASAVVEVANRLRWQRVLVPPPSHTLSEDCSAATLAVAHRLTSAGLFVRQQPLSHKELAQLPDVIILCSSDVQALRWVRGGLIAPTLLLLHLAPDDRPVMIPDTQASVDLKQENAKSIPTFKSFYSALAVKNNFSNHLNFSSPQHDVDRNFEGTKVVSSNNLSVNAELRRLISRLDSSSKSLNKDSVIEKKKLSSVKNRQKLKIDENQDVSSLWLNNANGIRPLILCDEPLESSPLPISLDDVYDEVLHNIKRYVEALNARTDTLRDTYYLYESATNRNPKWISVVRLTTISTRPLDGANDWTTIVKVIDPGGEFDRWCSIQVERSHDTSGRSGAIGAISALCACGTLALVVGGVVTARRVAMWRQRPRSLPVLAAVDFTFPVDERRVGEGMESMLSCWLQQLHEFGGPELERPDLLKRPPAAPAHPSAPSSTCSISRLALDRRTRYKGDPVHMKYIPTAGTMELKRKAVDLLLIMQTMRHENLNPFIGCLAEVRPAFVFEACGRGSLEDVLMADDIRLDWTFRLSLLTDLVRGVRYLHASPLKVHGRLSSRNCTVDSRWVLRVSDYGVPAFAHAQSLPLPQRSARDLLWTAPELLREGRGACRGTQAGDVFSFAIIMQEVIVRGEPYCMLALTPEEIVEKLCRPPPLIRPSVSMGAAPPEAVGIMRQCWSEAPDLRPDFARLYEIFRHMHRGRKINIVDSMFEMLEKYSNNLEELIKERTEQLDMEKKKTEQLLNRMLPRSVAERLMLGSRVEPEEFEEVSIYFSDIVGFTELAARSTPVQVVDLLNDLYTTFDAAIEQYRVYKVETIGDAYMVVGGLPMRTADHAESVATMALHLLHLAGRFRVRHLPVTPLHLRIGLHTGPCCAGVVGLTMPRYCLFGDTVNTASRMESTGAAWRIQVSAATADRLSAAGGYRLRSRGLRQIKGKGAMHTYWLLGKDGFDKPLPTPPPLESEEVLFESDAENDSERSNDEPVLRAPRTRSRAASDADDDCLAVGSRSERAAWARSGAVSADSSPPRLSFSAHSRYRCLAGSARALRRQWSLERGDALAMAVAEGAGPSEPSEQERGEPLALRVPPPRAPPVRYRTRPEP